MRKREAVTMKMRKSEGMSEGGGEREARERIERIRVRCQ